MRDVLIVIVIVVAIPLVMVAIYTAGRLFSAGWHRSKMDFVQHFTTQEKHDGS